MTTEPESTFDEPRLNATEIRILGSLIEINTTRGNAELTGAYWPAGPHWQDTVRTDRVTAITGAVDGLTRASAAGAQFVFGYLAGGDQPYPVASPPALFTFAFNVLPLIMVISALSALLWHWKILKWLIRGFGFLFQRTMGLGGASALAVAANIFLGTIESPIVIRAYLDKLTRSELFLMMVVGLATVAGSTMVAYAAILAPVMTNAAGHVLVASIVSAPAGVLLARIMIPETAGEGGAGADYASALKYDSAIDAIVKGTADGLMVVLNISAVLIVFVALVALPRIAGYVEGARAPRRARARAGPLHRFGLPAGHAAAPTSSAWCSCALMPRSPHTGSSCRSRSPVRRC